MHKKILHVITGLKIGGAETMLYKLIKSTCDGVEHVVISLTENGFIGTKLSELNIEVISINMIKSVNIINKFFELKKIIKNNNPDLVQTWMYHSDLIGGIAAKFAFKGPIIWNIRHSNLKWRENKKSTILIAKLSAILSNIIPDKIVSCSKIAKEIHAKIGYNKNKIKVIPNGFDILEFDQKKYNKLELYDELDIPYDNFTIGMVGRYNPQKDYKNLINAVSLLKEKNTELFNNTTFIICGKNIDENNLELISYLKEKNIEAKFKLLGRRNDIAKIMASLDLFTLSSSFGEGFPNVIGEAMASNTACVVTDVGDSAFIVGDTGVVVEIKKPEQLMSGWVKILSLSESKRNKIGEKARQRIVENFTIDKIAKKYLDLYNSLI